jgi:hypothetical protein
VASDDFDPDRELIACPICHLPEHLCACWDDPEPTMEENWYDSHPEQGE